MGGAAFAAVRAATSVAGGVRRDPRGADSLTVGSGGRPCGPKVSRGARRATVRVGSPVTAMNRGGSRRRCVLAEQRARGAAYSLSGSLAEQR